MHVIRRNHGKGHSYVDTDTGQKLDGVTTILGGGMPKPAIANWNATATAEYAADNWDALAALPVGERLNKLNRGRFEKKDAAGKLGTDVHKMGERLLAGERVVVPDHIKGYVQSYVRFMDEFQLKVAEVAGAPMVEPAVYHEKHRYAGQLDIIADVVLPDMPEYDHIPRDTNGVSRGLLDCKTTRSGIFGDVALQLVAYRRATHLILPGVPNDAPDDERLAPMPEVDFCAGIHVRANGYDLVPLECGAYQFRTFLAAKHIFEADREMRDWVGAPIVPPTASTYRLTSADGGADMLALEKLVREFAAAGKDADGAETLAGTEYGDAARRLAEALGMEAEGL